MKLTIHASVFSIVFASFVAGAVTTKPVQLVRKWNPAAESLGISSAMPVPNCPPDTGCPLVSQ